MIWFFTRNKQIVKGVYLPGLARVVYVMKMRMLWLQRVNESKNSVIFIA